MKALILFLLVPLFGISQEKQDTLPAILKIKQGNLNKYVKGYVVLVKDGCACKPVTYLRIKEELFGTKVELLPFPAKYKVVDYRLFDDKVKH